jgi:crotonobetainyl-CoA:carnitine CoA-transferase CaiB-like acyl-CoA transferase
VVNGPLAGLRVLDLTRFVAGSYTTALFASFGADVIKLEVPPDGDPYRVQGTARIGDESVLFLSLNSGKRSVALDFRKPEAEDAREALLASSDFLVENSRPGSLAAHGLDWEGVHARHPAIVYGSISGYGEVGPDAARGGFDLILQAESGVMSVTGSEQSGPVTVGTWHARDRDVRDRLCAGAARHAFANVRAVRRVPHAGRVDRAGRRGFRGSLAAMLHGGRW